MKTKISIVILIISIFCACEGSIDSAFNITKSDLVGSWALTNFEMDEASLIITNPGPTQSIIADVIGSDYNAFVSFSENPDIANVTGDFTLNISYNQTNVDIYSIDAFIFNDIFGFSTSAWVLNNNVLSLIDGGTNINIDVIDFTGNVLKIEVDVNETVTINGISSNVSGKAIVTLEK
jgi:hypothetical protein